MTLYSPTSEGSHRGRRLTARGRIAALVIVAGASALVATSAAASPASSTATQPTVVSPSKVLFPVGVPDRNEPSGKAPPKATALRGYTRKWVQDFEGKSMPKGWGTFAGQPSGNNTSYWAPSHVLVGGDMVRLVTYRDPRHKGKWVSGGICECKTGVTYGAFFVRSRVTGPGPDEDELLWPVANVWPPEVDFNESAYSAHSTSWTVHFGTGSAFAQKSHAFDLERWHTWGVIWTPLSLTFTIDGVPWGVITNPAEVPHQPMTLDIDQEARCVRGLSWAACPTHRVSLQINWVAEFARN